MRRMKRASQRLLSYLLWDQPANWLTRVFSKRLVEQMRGTATDMFLTLLLGGMDLAFLLSRSYRRQIQHFEAWYVFMTRDGSVGATARFADGDIQIDTQAKEKWTVRVTLSDSAALLAFLFSRDHDILDSLLKNEVTVDGNLNYLYKFGFMARDLIGRLGLTDPKGRPAHCRSSRSER